jgi:hypothetical protein
MFVCFVIGWARAAIMILYDCHRWTVHFSGPLCTFSQGHTSVCPGKFSTFLCTFFFSFSRQIGLDGRGVAQDTPIVPALTTL